MKKSLIIITLAVFLAACGISKEGTTTKSSDKPETVETKKPVAGDTVVARWSGTSFYEARIQSIAGAKATVTWSDDNKTGDVDMVDVYVMPASGSNPGAKVGDFVLAKTSTSGFSWDGCVVTKVEEGVITVKDNSDGSTSNVAPEKIIKVSPVLAADFKEEAKENDFLKKAQIGRPRAPEGYQVKSGHRVVGEWAVNSWYAGRVQIVKGDTVKIVWEGGSEPSEVTNEKVVPYPDASNYAVPVVNNYVLVKPSGTGRWGYAQVTAIGGSSIEVKTANGETRTLKPGEYVNIS